MRNIKFRAWDKNDKKMFYDIQNSYDTIGDVKPEDPCTSFQSFLEDTYNIFEVMQFTGFKDKNGNEIYEGDIYKYKDFLPRVVTWRESWRDEECYFIEIIGNIYENPELLEPK